jgi:hypothetical protein
VEPREARPAGDQQGARGDEQDEREVERDERVRQEP